MANQNHNVTLRNNVNTKITVHGLASDSTGRMPGTYVKKSGNNLSAAGTNDDSAQVFILEENQGQGQDYDQAYAQNATANAFLPQAGDIVDVNVVAATYTEGQALALGASGFLTAATSGNTVEGYVYDGARAISASDVTNGQNKITIRVADRVKM